MATLYISDLDGTLLNRQSQISEKSAKIINHLIKNDVIFSVATARNVGTAFDKIKELQLHAPISLMTGVFLYRQNEVRPLQILEFPRDTAEILLRESAKLGASPFLYTYHRSECMLYLSYKDLEFPARRQFYELRKHVKNKTFLFDPALKIPKQNIPVYINFLDHYEILTQVNDIAKELPGIQSVFYFDPVLKAWYLEVFSAKAGKAAGVRHIAEYTGTDKIVSFGDNNNDLSMFQISDESYATANAPQDIRKKASGVIRSCDEDGVAEFLFDRFRHMF